MADLGFFESEIRTLPEALRPTLLRLFRALLKDIRFGHPTGEAADPLLNLAGAFLHATTPAIASTELAIRHNFGRTPYLALPVLRLDSVGSSIVSLTVSRAADDKRIYVTSPVTNAPISLAVEG
jgi:hypothetical protein